MRAEPTHAVLIVEDEPFLRFDIVETFLGAGFHTFEAASALEAIKVLENHPEIRAVFTDVEMPGTMDGIQLAHVIRKRWPPTSSSSPLGTASQPPMRFLRRRHSSLSHTKRTP